MNLCVRIDLDYVPWDNPDAQDFGHGEPAQVLRLLELARTAGYKYHWFASNRVLRAFPAVVDAVLNEGHDLDWLCKRPDDFDRRFAVAEKLLALGGVTPAGFALRGPFNAEQAAQPYPARFRFATAPDGPAPAGMAFFPTAFRADRDALRAGQSPRAWSEGVRAALRQAGASGAAAVLVFRPQVLAKVDARLALFRELVDFGLANGYRLRTLREQTAGGATTVG